MNKPVFLFTPPFTQLNTPYPATAYLKGFLNTRNIPSYQSDLGIEVILRLFSKSGLTEVFNKAQRHTQGQLNENVCRMIALREDYTKVIEDVILFLQGKNASFAHLICSDDFLPRASRFAQMDELDWAFGIMGVQDKAKHLCTLFLEDISDLIQECIDPHFGFSRYAERLSRSANSFDELYQSLKGPSTYIDDILTEILAEKMKQFQPLLIAISIPFPGNLYAGLRAASWIKANYPTIRIALGGGYPNTELRSMSDPRLFEFVDFVTLDDGEAPLEQLISYLESGSEISLKRTFTLVEGQVKYKNESVKSDYKQFQTGTPDYTDLPLDKYISVIEVMNPMHRMWSDGRWNKLTMAHGCYWGKCTFCDISLDYIKTYEPIAASMLCDRMEELILQTGQNGFHFVDEAAPPALMRNLAIEILKRKLVVSWWTNIRFEKSFSKDLCILLKASGCVAISGGLEVASDRLLELIQKGVTVEQVAQVTRNFTDAGIMVHAYLMYGFPTQTVQETIDSLEMVRQMFECGILQSGFWHQFAMTAHSPVGMYPEQFSVKSVSKPGSFANNDIVHIDPKGARHEMFSYGLKKSLFNYMHGLCFEKSLQFWFDQKVPRTTVPADFISRSLERDQISFEKPGSKVVWLGKIPVLQKIEKVKKGRSYEVANLTFYTVNDQISIQIDIRYAEWFVNSLDSLRPTSTSVKTLLELKNSFEMNFDEDFEPFWYSKSIRLLRKHGLLTV